MHVEPAFSAKFRRLAAPLPVQSAPDQHLLLDGLEVDLQSWCICMTFHSPHPWYTSADFIDTSIVFKV